MSVLHKLIKDQLVDSGSVGPNYAHAVWFILDEAI